MATSPAKVRRQAREFVDYLRGHDGSSRAGQVADGEVLIDVAWATPLLVQLWADSLEDDEIAMHWRPALKRVLTSLRRRHSNGDRRSHADLFDLLVSARAEIRDSTLAVMDEFVREDRNPEHRTLLQSHGLELQLAADAQALRLPDELGRIATVAHGGAAAEHLRHLKHLQHVPQDPRHRSIWDGLYLRCALAFSIARFNPGWEVEDLAFLPRLFFSQTIFLDASDRSMIFTSSDIHRLLVGAGDGDQLGRDDQHITAYPLHPIDGGFVTTLPLVLDSIAPWLQLEIQGLDLWQTVVSAPFESDLIDWLRARGWEAGGVSEAGHWDFRPTGTPSATAEHLRRSVRDAVRSPGEIDILAWSESERRLVLVECKSLNSIGNAHSVASMLSPTDAQGWRSKLSRKRDWIESASGRRPSLASVVIEGVRFFDEADDDPIRVIHREEFEFMIDGGLDARAPG